MNLRLYSVRIGPAVDQCDGCGEPIAPHSPAIMREDRALFCGEVCAHIHDDEIVEHRYTRVAS